MKSKAYEIILPLSQRPTLPPSVKMERAILSIEEELEERLYILKANGKFLKPNRTGSSVPYDIEMMREIGFCQGTENYSVI